MKILLNEMWDARKELKLKQVFIARSRFVKIIKE